MGEQQQPGHDVGSDFLEAFQGDKERHETPPGELKQLLAIWKDLGQFRADFRQQRSKLPPYINVLAEADKILKSRGGIEAFPRQEDDFAGGKRMVAYLSEQERIAKGLRHEHADSLSMHLELADEYLDELLWYLKGQPVWSHHFTTGDPREQEARRDSHYFMTPDGVSLRLKTTLLYDDQYDELIQPMADKILFVKEPERGNLELDSSYLKSASACGAFYTSDISLDPTHGYRVWEYCSNDFHNLQEQGSSADARALDQVTLRQRGDVIEVCCEDLYGDHFGHLVNAVEEY